MQQQRKPTEIHVTGTLEKLEPKFTKQGKVWCDARISYTSKNFSKEEVLVQMPFKAFGDAAEAFAQTAIGSSIKVALDVVPNEYQGKYYVGANLIQFKILAPPVNAQPAVLPGHITQEDIPF